MRTVCEVHKMYAMFSFGVHRVYFYCRTFAEKSERYASLRYAGATIHFVTIRWRYNN